MALRVKSLALASSVKSLALALALMVKSLDLALALMVNYTNNDQIAQVDNF